MNFFSKRGIAAAGAGAGVLAAFLAIAQPFEGLRTTAYWDPYGKVWTVCYGETKGVKKGDRYTATECAEMLKTRVSKDFDPAVMAALKGPVPDKARAAFDDIAYNIGVGAFQRSTIVKRWNAGDRKGACNALLFFNKAGGKVLAGLVKRRKAEQAMCLEGIK